jgi:4-amino-4-deoxy-L-arabinose transferase-like glycosyltransferase
VTSPSPSALSSASLNERPYRRESDWNYFFALLVVAFLPRLFVALAWSREPVWDGHYYHFGGERIAAGLGYSEDGWAHGHLVWRPWVHYPVGYSALLGAAYKLFGSGLWVAPLLNAVFGALLAGVIYLLARTCLSRARACVAGGLVALHPGLIAYSALVMTELFAALLLSTAALLLLIFRGRPRGYVIAGLVFGVAILVRPSSLLLLPLAAFVESGTWLRSARAVAIVSGVALLVVLPWTIRNCQRFDGCALVSTNGGWNLAIGAISETGRFQTLRASDGCALVTGQVQQDRCWAAVGRRRILENPVRFLKLVPKKLAETFDHESFAFEYLHEADPVSWTESRRVAGRELVTGYHRLLMVFAALGIVTLPTGYRQNKPAFLVQLGLLLAATALSAYAFANDYHPFHWLVLFIVAFAFLPLPGRPSLSHGMLFVLALLLSVVVTHSLFFGEDRYHIVASPMLCILAAAALRPASEGRRGSRAGEPSSSFANAALSRAA